jgi:hypothetical protein
MSGVRPIDLAPNDGSPTHTNDMATQKLTGVFDFTTRISSISVDYPYVIAYGLSLVEIWNIEQVKHNGGIQWTYFGLIPHRQPLSKSSTHPVYDPCMIPDKPPLTTQNQSIDPFLWAPLRHTNPPSESID